MTVNQVVGLVLIATGLGDLVALALVRRRLPPQQVRMLSMLFAGFALALIGLGIAILVRGLGA